MKSLIMLARCKLSSRVNQIYREAFFDDPAFPQRELAAAIASKVFYYLEEYEESLRLALEAGDKFNINEKSQYVETLIHKCIDKYIEKRVQIFDQKDDSVKIDEKMEGVINKMFDRCFQDGQLNQAIGIALESRRLDMIREAIEKSNDLEASLSYTYTISENIIKSKALRNEILRMLLLIYEQR
jgi:26S proteasome regulatory subunit N2